MTSLTNEDLRFVVTRIPRDVRTLLSDVALFLGGGFIRETIAGNKPADVDPNLIVDGIDPIDEHEMVNA